MVMARKINKDKQYKAQFKIDPELIKKARLAYIMTYKEEIEYQDVFAAKVFEFFVNNVSTHAANQSK